MIHRSVRPFLAAALLAAAALAPRAAEAQAYPYPAFQPPTVIGREYVGAVADADDYGTSLIFQWREGISARSQFSVDAGFADPDVGDARLFLGGGYAYQLNRAEQNADLPLDLLLTTGIYANFGDGVEQFRLPVGVSIGRRFPLEGQFAITPFAHPRVGVVLCSGCGEEDSDLRVNFDLGANFEITEVLSLRAAVTVGGEDETGFGLGLAWRPRGMRR